MPAAADGLVAVDTSLAVPLLLARHAAHGVVTAWAAGRLVALCGHARLETYSVLTRLPGDARLDAQDAVVLMSTRFAPALRLLPATDARLPELLAELGVVGGAAYDAIIGLAALDNGCFLATRDARAKATYDAVGAQVELVV